MADTTRDDRPRGRDGSPHRRAHRGSAGCRADRGGPSPRGDPANRLHDRLGMARRDRSRRALYLQVSRLPARAEIQGETTAGTQLPGARGPPSVMARRSNRRGPPDARWRRRRDRDLQQSRTVRMAVDCRRCSSRRTALGFDAPIQRLPWMRNADPAALTDVVSLLCDGPRHRRHRAQGLGRTHDAALQAAHVPELRRSAGWSWALRRAIPVRRPLLLRLRREVARRVAAGETCQPSASE